MINQLDKLRRNTMHITNLQELKKNINLSSFIIFSIIFTSALIGAFFMHSSAQKEKAIQDQKEIIFSQNLYKSNLSEKLSIIASSSVFFDYLHSGDETRDKLYPQFLAQIFSLNSKSIVGMKIMDANSKNIFNYGESTGPNVVLRLCYMDNVINASIGDCSFNWQLFFSPKYLLTELIAVNPGLKTCENCSAYNFFSGQKFGSFPIKSASNYPLNLDTNQSTDNFFYHYLILMTLALIILSIWSWSRLSKMLNRYLQKPLTQLTQRLKTNQAIIQVEDQNNLEEIQYLGSEIESWKETLSKVQADEQAAKIGHISAQVAHDIRSPLAALETAITLLSNVPEKQRILIRSATNQIRDIANNLLVQYRTVDDDIAENYKNNIHKNNLSNNENTPLDTSIEKSAELITDMLSSVVSEKRLQYKDTAIKIITDIHEVAYSAFSLVSGIEFKRVISNIINNCVEALEKNTPSGVVRVTLSANDNNIFIQIEDNGCGMNEEMVQKIMSGNANSQKKSGNGLGLKHAIQTIQRVFSGKFAITSTPDVGTIISITLPNATPPQWFATDLTIPVSRLIVVLDDDESIHQVWENRFKSICAEIQFIHFYQPEELIKWRLEHPNLLPLILCDYELIGSKKTGLDVIEEIEIFNHAHQQTYLVTSRYEESIIRKRCLASDVRIIPKSFAPHIQIHLDVKSETENASENIPETATKNITENASENMLELLPNNELVHPDIIFIDDNESITLAWELEGMRLGKNVVTFNRMRDLLAVIHQYKKDTPIYIDANLNDKITGQAFAKELHEKGYHNLFLATGYAASDFGDMPWIKKIVGKNPCFESMTYEKKINQLQYRP